MAIISARVATRWASLIIPLLLQLASASDVPLNSSISSSDNCFAANAAFVSAVLQSPSLETHNVGNCCCTEEGSSKMFGSSSQVYASIWYDIRVLRSYALLLGSGLSMEGYLDALNAVHYPLTLHPPQPIKSSSFSDVFFDYRRATDRLLFLGNLLDQCPELQSQLPHGVFSDCPICAFIPDLAQLLTRGGRGPHQQRLDAAKARCMKHELEHGLDVLECFKRHGEEAGESSLIARGLLLYKDCELARHRTQFEQLIKDAHELRLKRDELGPSGKDTRTASKAIKSKLRQARHLATEMAQYQPERARLLQRLHPEPSQLRQLHLLQCRDAQLPWQPYQHWCLSGQLHLLPPEPSQLHLLQCRDAQLPWQPHQHWCLSGQLHLLPPEPSQLHLLQCRDAQLPWQPYQHWCLSGQLHLLPPEPSQLHLLQCRDAQLPWQPHQHWCLSGQLHLLPPEPSQLHLLQCRDAQLPWQPRQRRYLSGQVLHPEPSQLSQLHLLQCRDVLPPPQPRQRLSSQLHLLPLEPQPLHQLTRQQGGVDIASAQVQLAAAVVTARSAENYRFHLRPLRALVTTGYEQAWDMLAQQYAAATGIQVQVVAWADLPPFYTTVGCLYKQQVVGIPFLHGSFLMYVNWPLLISVYNITPPVLVEFGRLSFYPDTWQELAAVMRQVNATASDPVTGKPRHALCMPLGADSIFLFVAVMASIMQTGGTSQGWLYDPLTLEPLTNNTAMLKALEMMWELSPFLRGFDTSSTIDMSQCAVALAPSSLFKSLHPLYSNAQFMGQLTMSPLPASTEVLDRSTMQLVPCTAQLCNSQRATKLGGQLVNLAPTYYVATTGYLGISSRVPLKLRTAVYNLIAYIGSPSAMKVSNQSYTSALKLTLMPSITATDFRVADSLGPMSVLQRALFMLIGCTLPVVPRSAGSPADFAAAMTSMTAGLRAVRDSLGAAAFREQLWGTTGFVPPTQPPPPTPPSPSPPLAGGPALSTPLLATVIAVPVGLCLAVMVLLVVIITHLRRNAKLQRSLLGHVLPPAAGDKATLVITDVQGSSKLWETLPAGVMEASMKVHDELVRRLALDSSGYEWATEGDSFLLCFHTPQAAVAFATQLQLGKAVCNCGQPSQSMAVRSCAQHAQEFKYGNDGYLPSNLLQGLLNLLASKPRSWLEAPSPKRDSGSTSAMMKSANEPVSMARPDALSLGQGSVGWQRLCALYHEVEVEEPAALTVLAGLRVRVGMHTGLTADEVLFQRRMGAKSIAYGGAALVLAKAVQLLLPSGSPVPMELPVEELRAAGISVVHMGKHLVELGEGKGDTALDLYCATLDTPAHAHRLWALGPLRTARQLQPGVLHAPYGMAATAFMSVVGLAQLRAWDASLAKECLALYQATAQRVLLHVAGRQLPAGYLVSSADEDGMVLAAFSSSLQCLHWALLTLTTCMDLDWPQALLDSALGEEVVAEQHSTSWSIAADSTALAGSSAAGLGQAGCSTVTPSHSVRLLRGLRLKAGVDVGEVACDLTPANGRFNYRGRCLNRAARINGLAASGQVWCSEASWVNVQSMQQPILSAAQARDIARTAAGQTTESAASWSFQPRCRDRPPFTDAPMPDAQPPRAVSFGYGQPPPATSSVNSSPGPPAFDVCQSFPHRHNATSWRSVAAQWHDAQQLLHCSITSTAVPFAGSEGPSHNLRTAGQPLSQPQQLPPLVARPLGCRELRGIPGQVALVQVSLAAHTSRGQLEAADRLGLMAPGLKLSRTL
ncbi:hypothetical protein V8C86DRAFT_3026625 [Haematococcus lacustris]